MKRGILLIGGLLSLFTLASCGEEAKVEYRDRIVEVEKPVEVIKEVEVVKEVEVPVEVEKTVYIDRPIEKIVEKEVKVEVPVEKIVEVEKPVYVERSQVDLNGLAVTEIGDNLYEFEFTASQCYTNVNSYTLPITKMFDLNGIYINDDYTSAQEVFRRGELVSKPGYIIKDITLVNPRKMATPTVLDNDYDGINPSNIDLSKYKAGVVAVKYEYTDINKEQIHISFNRAEIAGTGEFYGAEVVRVTFAINNTTYIRPGADQIIYGYAGLQINNGDCIYRRGYVGETVTSEELENFVLSLYPKCKITARNYSTFTTTYDTQRFTTKKIWIERIS